MKNKKFVFAGILTTLLIGILIVLNNFTFLNPLETYSKDFHYDIKYCENRNFDLEETVKKQGIDNLSVIENSVKFDVLLLPYCNADQNNFKLKYERNGNKLQIIALFKDIKATKCVCPVKIFGTISNLENGNYTLTFIFDNRYAGTKDVIDEKKFEIK